MGALNFPDPATDGLVHEKWQYNLAEDKWELIPVQLSPVDYTAGEGLDLTDYEFSNTAQGLWDSQGGGVISYTGGNVGIGTTSPAQKLTLADDTDPVYIFWSRGSTDPVEVLAGPTPTVGQIGTSSNHSFRVIANNNTVATFAASGNVGIEGGTSTKNLSLINDAGNTYAYHYRDADMRYGIAVKNDANNKNAYFLFTQDANTFNTFYSTTSKLRIGTGSNALTNGMTIDNSGNLNVSGAVTASGDVTAFSDIAVKEDINPITEALSKVSQLGGYTFKRKNDDSRKYTGVIAQEVQKVLPEAVHGGEEGLSVAYGNLVGLLIEAVKEQQVQINELKDKLEK